LKTLYKNLIFLYPFQILSIPIGSTRFDLFPISIFIANLLGLLILLRKRRLKLSVSFFSILFGSITFFSVLFIFYNPQPGYRFASASFWLLNLMILAYSARYLYTSRMYRNFLAITLLSSIIVITIYFFGLHERPAGLFLEPSTAGLIFYSLALLYFTDLLVSRVFNLKKLLVLAIYIIAGLITKSSHIFIFIIFSLIIFLQIVRIKQIHFRKILISAFPVLISTYFSIDYYVTKFNFNSSDLNLSQLSWLRGLDQAKFAINNSPFFGFGLGSTGYFEFPSQYNLMLSNYDASNLNLYDAYSLFSRLTIEIGLISTMALIFYIFKPLLKSLQVSILNKSINESTSIYIVGSFLFAGSLLKEPNYGLSPIFISILFLGISIPRMSKKPFHD
jgi:hypothetical protein